MAKMNTNSNAYTIIYASVMVIVVAFLLAFVASALKPTQDANVENDVKNQILIALNIESTDVATDYANTVQDMLIKDGQLVPYEGKFNTSYGKEIKNGNLHLFVANTKDGKKYVVPMTGMGLWGGLWGYIALDEDFQTVYGTYFSHEGETAGLGALIAERKFQESFIGKKLFGADATQVELTVMKKGTHEESENIVDGVTGATLTSNGVAAMVKTGLQLYVDAYSQVACPAAMDCTCEPEAEASCCCGEACACESCECAASECKCESCECDPCECASKCACAESNCCNNK